MENCENAKGCTGECKVVENYGAQVARVAILDMEPPKDDAMEFIKKCKDEGKEPINVVRYILNDRDMDLCDASSEDDQDTRKLRALLREVVRQVVEEAAGDKPKECAKSEDSSDRKVRGYAFGYTFTW